MAWGRKLAGNTNLGPEAGREQEFGARKWFSYEFGRFGADPGGFWGRFGADPGRPGPKIVKNTFRPPNSFQTVSGLQVPSGTKLPDTPNRPQDHPKTTPRRPQEQPQTTPRRPQELSKTPGATRATRARLGGGTGTGTRTRPEAVVLDRGPRPRKPWYIPRLPSPGAGLGRAIFLYTQPS